MKTKNILKVALLVIFVVVFNSVEAQHKHHNSSHHKPHYRYSDLPHWGHAYKAVPKGFYVYPYHGVKYHYYNGIYYKPVGTKYVIVRPPAGIRVRTLPTSTVHFVINGRNYFYYYGTYYVKSTNDEFISVAPPVGAQVDALPDGYRKVIIDDQVYYEFEGTYYKAFMYNDGEVWYEVVGQK